jgi:hypothetical protein
MLHRATLPFATSIPATAILVTSICCLTPRVTLASGCERPIAVPIHFSAGAVCWRHTGTGTTFNGQFAAHQHVTASAIGQTFNADGTRTWVTTGPWQLFVTGPGGFSASANDKGQLDTVLPSSGTYSFEIGPCAVWGNQGTVEICAN